VGLFHLGGLHLGTKKKKKGGMTVAESVERTGKEDLFKVYPNGGKKGREDCGDA